MNIQTHPEDLTQLIQEWQSGNRDSGAALIERLYPELKRIARGYLAKERPNHTLAPTALVNELYLKFMNSATAAPAQNRVHFLALAAQSLRHILVDHARIYSAKKRGNALKVDLTLADAAIDAHDQDFLLLDEALTRLEALDPRAGRVVELRFFGGLSEEEVAETLGVSRKTVQRDWQTARAWLLAQLLHSDKAARAGS